MSGAKRRGSPPPDSPPPTPPDLPPRLDDVISALDVVVYKARIEDGYPIVEWIAGALDEYLGCGPEEIVGKRDFLLGKMNPDDMAGFPDAIASLLDHGHATIRYRVRHPDGTERWIHDVATLVEDETGRCMLGRWTDATERVAIAAALDHRAKADKAIGHVARRLLDMDAEELPAVVVEELENVGELLGFDSGLVVLFRRATLTVDAEFEWHRQGMAAGIDMSVKPGLDVVPVALVDEGTGVLAAPRVDDVIPPQATERRFLAPGIKSLYLVPLGDPGSPIGFVGFTSQATERELSPEDIAVMQTLAEILAGALVRRRMAGLLRASERQLGEVATDAQVGTWSISLGEPAMRWSDETSRILGIDTDVAQSSDLYWLAIHPDDRERLSEARAGALESGSFSCDHRVLLPDGSERFVRQTGRLVLDERGQPNACTGTVQDISDRVRSERSAADTQRLLTSFLEALGGEAFIKDRDGRYLLVNAFFERTWGVSRENVVGGGDESVFGPETAADLRAADLRIMATQVPEDVVYEGLRSDGHPWVWRTHKAPIVDADGQSTGVCGVGFDITLERNAEAAVQASETRLAAIVAAIPDAVTLVDRDCTVLWANQVAADLVGTDPIGRHWFELFAGSPQRCPGCELDRVIGTGVTWQHEYEAVVRGAKKTFWASCAPWSSGDAEHPATVLTMTGDITGRKAYERGLVEVSADLEREVAERVAEIERSRKAALSLMQDANLERERAQKALAEHETLLREVHHRVKNNLNTVANILYFQSRAIDGEQARLAFADSQDRIRSMARVHEHLYRSWDIATVNMAAYLQDLVDDLGQIHGAEGLTFGIEADGVSLDIDHAVPCGLLVNELLTNACKHAFPSGGGRIEVHLVPHDDGYLLDVQDDGVGMPAGFDLEANDTLGLRLAGMLARQFGDELHVDPTPGGGTTFAVSFSGGSAVSAP